jgi:hypothetical protein
VRKLLLVLLLIPALAWAGNTGAKHGSAFSDVNSAWATETDIYSSDDNYAVDGTSGTDNYLYVTGFSMSVPTDSVIDSIVVFAEGYGSAISNRRCLDASLSKDGSSVVGEEVAATCLGNAVDAQGPFQIVPTDPLWSTTWTVSEVNASTFGIRIDQTANTTSNFYVDDITINIYYSAAPTSSAQPQIIIVQ